VEARQAWAWRRGVRQFGIVGELGIVGQFGVVDFLGVVSEQREQRVERLWVEQQGVELERLQLDRRMEL
jgi:hypothetical protein